MLIKFCLSFDLVQYTLSWRVVIFASISFVNVSWMCGTL